MGNDPPQRGRIVVIAMSVLMVGGSIVLTYFMHKSSTQLVTNLDSPNSDKVGYSLEILKDRRDPAAIAKAKELLQNNNPDIWQGAALYLGAMGKAESIPYLIKTLQTAEGPELHEISVDLTTMTGRDFGTHYDDWQKWWLAKK
jgi:hypothetical protein